MAVAAAFIGGVLASAVEAQDSESAELAKKLQNPVANLISVPIQNNWDFGIGPADAMGYTANIQPVIPFSLAADWMLVTRTIVPVVYQESPVRGGDDEAGLGDLLQSFFLSPAESVGGWIVGGGPALLYPTATEDSLGLEKFALGPTVVALQQRSGWTYGALVNHLWSAAGDRDRDDVNATFLQPFVSYTTQTVTTIGVSTESTYDWRHSQWTVPLNASVSQLVKLGGQRLQLGIGGRTYVVRPDHGPDWGLRFTVTFLFPR